LVSPRLESRAMLTVTFTTIPIPLVELIEPAGITKGPDGNLWFTESGSGRIGRMTPAGVVTEFAVPKVPAPAGSPPGTPATPPPLGAITIGPDGALWFTGVPGEIGRITTAGVVTEFAVPAVPPPAGSPAGTATTPASISAITAGPDGALWFTGVPGAVGRITTSGVVTEFAVPDIPPAAGSPAGAAGTQVTPSAITAGPDGALWFAGVPGKVGRITTAGVVAEFAVPDIPPPAGSAAGTAATQATLTAITSGPDGALWFTGIPAEVGRITTTGVVTEFAEPEAPAPAGSPAGTGGSTPTLTAITTGPDGNLWLTTLGTDSGTNPAIGRITASGVFTFFDVPGNFSIFGGLTAGPDGNLWFTEQEDGTTAGEQPAVGEITPAAVTTLHTIPVGTTLDPTLGVGVDAAVGTIAANGDLWFTEHAAIGLMTTDGTIRQFPVNLNPSGASIEDITAGPNGGAWFTMSGADANGDWIFSVGRITTDGAITMYPLPANSGLTGITEGRDGSVWFAENVSNPNTGAVKNLIGRITPGGVISSFAVRLPKTHSDIIGGNELTAITTGPDGNIWFTGDYPNNQSKFQSLVGRVTAKGQVQLFELPSSLTAGSSSANNSSYPTDIDSLISGPDGKLWFAAMDHGKPGIARISTGGKLAQFIPANIQGDLNAGPDRRVWFFGSDQESPMNSQLALATRSGIVVTRDLPQGPVSYGNPYGGFSGLAIGANGDLWSTNGSSSIVRMSAQDTPAGGLDYRSRPRRAPDYSEGAYSTGPYWTNVTACAHPTFSGVARPGSEVTLWVQKQGAARPVMIGKVHAKGSDGSWMLTSHVKLSDGSYAVTASQAGDTGPPTSLYTLDSDPSSVSVEPLVIDTKHAKKASSDSAK